MDPIYLIFFAVGSILAIVVAEVETYHLEHRIPVPEWVYYFAGIAIALFIAALWVHFVVDYDPYPVAMLHHVR